jgi:hypothetical protein
MTERSPRVEPYHITIEIDNRQCKTLKLFAQLGIQRFELTDIRGYIPGLTKHLVKLSREQFEKIPKGSFRTQKMGNLKERHPYGLTVMAVMSVIQ